ncbi:MAG: hypothetical protein GY720_21640 [bacterium]|nr:hypothetical protein [bacterium]
MMHNLLPELLALDEIPKITLQIPGSSDLKTRSLTVRHMLEKTSRRLAALEVQPATCEIAVERARSLAEDPGLATVRSGTAAVYVAHDFAKAVLWPAMLPERVEVGIEFHLSDAVELLDRSHCYLLTLSRGTAGLFRADAMSLESVELPDVPASFAEATEHLDVERQSQVHQARAGGRGGSSAVHHGIGVGEGRDVEELRNYLRAIDLGVRTAVAGDPGPIALVGSDEMPTEFRDVTHLDKLVDEVSRVNPEGLGNNDLRRLADEVLRSARTKEAMVARQHIADLAAAGKGSYDLGEVLAAAGEGKVDTLLLGSNRATASGPEGRRLNRAVVASLRHRSRVLVDEDLSESLVAASYRY